MTDNKRILIIEDEPDIVKISVFRLIKAGYEVITAVDGDEGLILAKDICPDLILLDLNIPGLDGRELCRNLKADENFKDIPVIIMTASVLKIKEKVDAIGADELLLKPYEPRDLLSIVRKFLSKSSEKRK